MKVYFSLIVSLFLVLLVEAQEFTKAQKSTQRLFNKELKKNDVSSAFLAVYSPSRNIDWTYFGAMPTNKKGIGINTPFYTASIGKTITATAIVILYERGLLNFSDKIIDYLPDTLVNGLHVFDGRDYSSEITIAQLLQHTSGLPDYFEDKTIDGSPNGMTLLMTDTSKFWSPVEMVNLAKYKMTPNFAPGTAYHYTDTEYILLGLIIEKIAGFPLHEFFRKNIFTPLEMNHTYMYLRSEPISKTQNMAEFYIEEFDIWTATSLSLDWAGGGVVSTTTDLINFQEALFSNKIISEKSLKQMMIWTPESKGSYYGYGIRKISLKELFFSLADLTMIGHTGSTSSFMFYCPELDVYLCGTLNQFSQRKQSVLIPLKVLGYIQKEIGEN